MEHNSNNAKNTVCRKIKIQLIEMNKQRDREPWLKETKEQGRSEPAAQLTIISVQPLINCPKKMLTYKEIKPKTGLLPTPSKTKITQTSIITVPVLLQKQRRKPRSAAVLCFPLSAPQPTLSVV